LSLKDFLKNVLSNRNDKTNFIFYSGARIPRSLLRGWERNPLPLGTKYFAVYCEVFYFVGTISFVLIFIIIFLIYDIAIALNMGFFDLFFLFFIMMAIILSFGNLLLFSFLFFASGKLFSGSSSYKKILFANSISFIPLIFILLLTIPEASYLKKEVFEFNPLSLAKSVNLNLHIFLFLIKFFLYYLHFIFWFFQLALFKIFFLKALMNVAIGLSIPFLTTLIFFLLSLIIFKSVN